MVPLLVSSSTRGFGGWPGATPVNTETVGDDDYLVFGLPAEMAGQVSVSTRYLPSNILGGDCFDFDWLDGVTTLGLTAGASAPEILVREVVNGLAARYEVTEEIVETARESIAFKLPRGLEAV